MVRRFIFILLLTLANLPRVYAGEMLELLLEQQSLNYGEALKIKLRTGASQDRLDRIDLSALRADFYIERGDYSVNDEVDTRKGRQQVFEVTLWPRKIGRLHIPSLTLGGIKTTERYINIGKAQFRGNKIKLSLHTGNRQYWQRQNRVIYIEVLTRDKFASLATGEFRARGINAVPINSTRTTVQSEQGVMTRLVAGWVLSSGITGKQQLDLPAVYYELGGTRQRRFHFPVVETETRPLPPYIPPTMPVGRVDIDSQFDDSGWFDFFAVRNELAQWKVRLSSQQVLPRHFPAVLRSISSDASVRIFPVDTSTTVSAGIAGVQASIEHTLPLTLQKNGIISLPDLSIQYFNPVNARLETVVHRSPSVFVLPAWLWWLLVLFCGFILYRLGLVIYTLLQSRLARLRLKKQALHQLRMADSAREIRQALRLYAQYLGDSGNLSLGSLLRLWQHATRCDQKQLEGMREAIDELSTLSYSGASGDVIACRQRLVRFLG